MSADVNWNEYVAALRPEGTLVIVGLPESDLKITAFPIIQGGAQGQRWPASSPSDIAAMLAFSARTGVRAMIEKFPLSEVNAAIDRARSGKVRYRAVLEV